MTYSVSTGSDTTSTLYQVLTKGLFQITLKHTKCCIRSKKIIRICNNLKNNTLLSEGDVCIFW